MAFNFKKSLQASSYLLRLAGKQMDLIRLLKLLYVAERETFAATGRSITGDVAFSMEYGPVLSRVYDCIKGVDLKASDWDDYIHTDGHTLRLVDDPGRGELNRGIVEKLTEITDRYRNVNDWDICELTHDFQEWKKPSGKVVPIPWQAILVAQGKPEMVSSVEEDDAARKVFDDVFGPKE